jgi:hypothetical protein
MGKLASFDLVQFESVPFGWLVAFTLAIALFAVIRPTTIRDYDNQRLPQNPTARAIFVIMYVFIYVALAAGLYVSGQTISRILEALPSVASFMKSFTDQMTVGAPVVAFIALGALWQIPFVKEMERAFLITLHSTRHLHNDIQLLSQRLVSGVFDPPTAERAHNLNHLKKHGVFVSDDDPGPVDLTSINNWRKVSSLLRLLRSWEGEHAYRLNGEEQRLLDRIETAHERKTQLALTIIRVTRQPQGTQTTKLLADLMQRLSTSTQLDRADLEEVESRAKALLSGEGTDARLQPVRLSQEEFNFCLSAIAGYFEIEYDILLQQLALLAAKSTVLAGETAPERLQRLKAVGFTGLGQIERINLDIILWLFLVATFGGFLVVYLPNMGQQANPQALARFTLSMSIAGLIGALVGSIRRNARAMYTPWSRYFFAGIVAAALYVGFTLVHNLLNEVLQIPRPAGQRPFSLEDTMTWSLLPLMLTVAIAYLARFDSLSKLTWLSSRFPWLDRYSPILERMIDGICVSAVVLVGYYGAVVLHPLLGVELSQRFTERMQEPHILPIPIYPPLQALAFVIGFFFVRTARRVSHATIVEDVKSETPKPNAQQVSATSARAYGRT